MEQEIEEYSKNPFIEALPHIFSDEEVAERLKSYLMREKILLN